MKEHESDPQLRLPGIGEPPPPAAPPALLRQDIVFDARRALHSSESNEWYTPAKYLERARQIMGGIDLDPASCAVANTVVRATRYYTSADDGLAQPWSGRVWLNPPYGKTRGRSNQEVWSARLSGAYLAREVDQGVLLVNAATDTAWFQRLWIYPICFVAGRIKFWHPGGAADSPTHGSAFVYLGKHQGTFAEGFGEFGTIARAWVPGERKIDVPEAVAHRRSSDRNGAEWG